MKIEHDQLFRELEPPPGGAARLRAKLGSDVRRSIGKTWWLGPAAVGAIALIAVIAFRSMPTIDPLHSSDSLMMATAFDRLLGRESEPFELSVSQGLDRLEVSRLTSGNPRVRLYSVDVAPSVAEEPGDSRL